MSTQRRLSKTNKTINLRNVVTPSVNPTNVVQQERKSPLNNKTMQNSSSSDDDIFASDEAEKTPTNIVEKVNFRVIFNSI